ncbi:Uncharacterised protein [Streptococcus pneumoniae]|nr:Uncharacterised protein [Streptococcus pneumoniae]
MILMTKNINLTNEELELIQGGADPYGKEPNGYYPWQMEPVLTMPVHGFCPRGTDDYGERSSFLSGHLSTGFCRKENFSFQVAAEVLHLPFTGLHHFIYV